MTGKRKAFKRFLREIFSDEQSGQGASAPAQLPSTPQVPSPNVNPMIPQNASTATVPAVRSDPDPPAIATISSTSPPVKTPIEAPQSATVGSTTAQQVSTISVLPSGAEYNGWTGLKLFADVLSKTPDVFGPLKHAANVLVSFIGSFETAAENRTEWQQLKSQLNALFDDLSEHIGTSTPPTMTNSINNLQHGIKKETDFIEQIQKRSDIHHYLSAEQDVENVLKCYRRIEDLFRRLTLNANLNTWKTVEDLATHTYLQSLPNSEAAYFDSAEATNLNRAGCTENTRVDVLRELREWADGASPEKIYWLNGMAGTGKTTIAYSLCKRLKEKKSLAASFFCSRQLPECRNVNRIVPTLAYQLAYYSDPFRHVISPLLKADPKIYNKSIPDQFKELIVEPINKVKDSMPVDLIIVIDALDECDAETGVTNMINVLLANAPDLPLRFFVSSRPDESIITRMRQTQADGMKMEMRLHELASSIVQADIRTYLKTNLEPCMNVSRFEIDLLVERSGVLFIYASTIVRYVTVTSPAKRAKRLEEVLAVSATNANASTRGIDALYTSILSAVYLSEDLNPSDRDEMMLVLRTIICACEPLSADTMADLLKLDGGQTVRDIISPLLSILRISESGVITTLHESFRDFFFSESRSGNFYCHAASHHARLAELCFEKTNTHLKFNIAGLESSYVLDKDVLDLDRKIQRAISPALFYACCYWDAHISQANGYENLARPLSGFLSEQLIMWMEVMNLKRVFGHGIRMLYGMKEWSQDVEAISKESKALLEDGWRFMSAHSSSAVLLSTPHIYTSALLFWPDTSPRNEYEKRKTSSRHTSTALANGTIDIWDARTGQQVGQPLKGHTNWVNSVAYSHDSAYIVSGSSDNTVRIWDARTGKQVGQPLEGHTNWVNSVAYSHDSAYIVSGSSDNTVRIWDALTGKQVGQPLEGHTDSVNSVAYSHDSAYIVSGSDDNTVRIWDARTGKQVGQPLEGHTDSVNSVAYSHDSAYIVSGSDDNTVRIWDARTGKQVGQPLEGHTNSVYSVAYSYDSAYIVSGSYDKTVRIWDARTGKQVGQPLEGHTNSVRSVAYSHDSAYIVSGSYDKTVRIWDAHTGMQVGQPLEGHTYSVNSVAYSHDSAYIVSGSDDNTVRIWDARTGKQVGQPLEGHTDSVNSVAYSHDSAYIVSGSDDNTVRIWDARTGKQVGQPLEGHTNSVYSVAYSYDSAYIVSGSYDKTVRIWDARTGKQVGQPLEGHTNSVRSVAYSHDSAYIVSGSYDKTVRIWDAHAGTQVGQPLEGHTYSVNSVAYSHDSAYIVSGSDDNTVRIWDARTGKQVGQPLEGHTNSVYSVAYSHDSAYIVSGSYDKTVRIWDARTGQQVGQPLEGHTNSVKSVAYSHDSAYIVSGSLDNTVRIWNAHTGKQVGQPLEGHTDSVYSVAYSHDSAYIVSGSWDNTVRIWDALTGQQVGQYLEERAEPVYSVVHSRNDTCIGSGSGPGDKAVRQRTTDSHHNARPASASSHICASACKLDGHHQPWVLNSEGWVVLCTGEFLVWVPDDLRPTLLSPQNTCIASSRRGVLYLKFDRGILGKNWAQFFNPSINRET
ncbi:WD repeat-containing protein [Ceratobasidium sp. AG-Ba]|nr:WD repeat-containing protein [Ceratobasidium sp. AG-Ba]